jgi:hypothetical protein
MKNKRGDIPVMILVIGVFAVCTLALLSFYSSIGFIKHSFVGTGLIEQLNSEVEQSSFSGSLDGSGIKNINGEKFFYQEEKAKEHIYSLKKEKLLFSVKYPVAGN